MSRVLRSGAFLLLLLIVGCSLIPSGWRIGGSPLAKNDKAQTAAAAAREPVLQGAQESAHMTQLLLAGAAATEPAIAEARGYASQTVELLDQSLGGAPAAANVAKWRQLATNLVSADPKVRAEAKAEQTDRSEEIARLSDRLAQATAAAQRANTRALAYAAESEGYADFARKLKLGFFALIGLIVLGTILSLLARFYPAFGLAAKAVNAVVAPGITFVAHRAEEGLKRVGTAIAAIRKTGALGEQLIEQHFDGVTDADHQRIIAAAATAAGAGPPASTS